MTLFASEKHLVNEFVTSLSGEGTPWGQLQIAREFDYQRGRTDVLALTCEGVLIAFEAKLTRWRDALAQAYRNRCFADASFVVLPHCVAMRALKYENEFERRGVGICAVDQDGNVAVLVAGPVAEPLQGWLRTQAKGVVAPATSSAVSA